LTFFKARRPKRAQRSPDLVSLLTETAFFATMCGDVWIDFGLIIAIIIFFSGGFVMAHLFKPAFVRLLAVAFAALTFGARAADKSAEEASEQTPGAEMQGRTASEGPRKYGHLSDKKDSAPAEPKEKPAARAEAAKAAVKEPAAEAKGDKAVAVPQHGLCQKCGKECSGNICEKCFNKIPGPITYLKADETAAGADGSKEAAAKQEKAARELARKNHENEKRVRAAIRGLGTTSWRESQDVIINSGKIAVPFLIEALGNGDEYAAAAYNLGGHSKADSGRATRNRSIAEVCSELLTTLVTQHSSFKGELPTMDQKEWQAWWAANGDGITFGK
jgi:hypothetical protein